ncbi:circularly permutated Ras protein 1-like isoform X1 [Esox lucius]|uniref:VWFA domain-containing protein n=2 Tax=Esox lucius TaxID=8010 RepID=A0A3P8Y1G4_ESOLU|nr:circularly permutated Ras protein 1-like isoform X1 [Esox lucius]
MEFSCEFVYISPSTYQKEVPKKTQIPFKRSALLPPPNRLRPCRPTPPTAPSTELQTPKPPLPQSTVTESILKDNAIKIAPNPSALDENAAFHLKRAMDIPDLPQPPTSRRTALLPPNMRSRSAACIQQIPGPSTSLHSNSQIYELPKDQPDIGAPPLEPDYLNILPEASREETKLLNMNSTSSSGSTQKSAPALPPRPSFMKSCPEYLVLLPTSPSPFPSAPPLDLATGSGQPLPGNPNVVLVSLGKLISQDNVLIEGEPTSCSQCGSVLDSYYDNVVNACYFCQPMEPSTSNCLGYRDSAFLLTPGDKELTPADSLLLFCIDISGSMTIISQVSEGSQQIYESRLQFVQEAVLQSVYKLSETKPHMQIGLITFNHQVTLHGYEESTSRLLWGDQLIDSEYLKKAAFSFPSPPPISRTRHCLQREIFGLSANGATALGPAALVAIAMASRQPGSKVIICTDGKANTGLGNLEVEDHGARALLASTIFYQDLGTYAATQGVTVSVLAIEGTDCRLDELGRMTDRTGGKVVIASPHELYTEFEEIIENRTIATHCSATLLLPANLLVRGEREAGHKGTREVGNVTADSEITFQFGAHSQGAATAPVVGSRVSVQLQLRYRQTDGGTVLRVLTAEREVTDDSSEVLSSLHLGIIQLNSTHVSGTLAVRGRFQDARREGEMQSVLIERALEYKRSAEDSHMYSEWVKTMEPIYKGLYNYTRKQPTDSDSQQTLTDKGAALFYTMKNSNRNSLNSFKKGHA